jgi:hypothetical protein
MVRCQNCKAENGEKDVYCAQCGFPLHGFPDEETTQTRQGYETHPVDLVPPPPSIAHGTPSERGFDYHRPANEYGISYQPGEKQVSSLYPPPGWEKDSPVTTWNGNDLVPQGKPRLKRSFSEYILGTIFTIWGAFWLGLGLYGFLEGINSSDNVFQSRAVGAAILCMLLVIFIGVIILIRHKYPRLHWWQVLLGQGGAFIAGVLIIIIGAVYLTIIAGASDFTNLPAFDFLMGAACMCYGVAAAFFALW